MNKREKSAHTALAIKAKLRCPLCHASVEVVALKSLICDNNHTYDFAKQGYINFLPKPVNTQYDEKLFEARQNIICDADLYDPLHEEIASIIQSESNDNALIFDAGSGEGSHLQRILNKIDDKNLTGIGLDISKEGVVMAAKNYEAPMWVVGDLANPPLNDRSVKYILNILSPANYKEFKRILSCDGIIIKVIPGSNYLKELRVELFKGTDESEYENNDALKLLQKNVDVMRETRITYTKTLNKRTLENLISMTPLGWHAENEDIERFISNGEKEITIDLYVCVAVSNDVQ